MLYNNAARTAETYRVQQIMTAAPAELTLMLYNGAIKFTIEAIKAMEIKDFEQANTSCIKAQNIISEFMATLKTDYDFTRDWMKVYQYIHDCLIQGNLESDTGKLAEAKELITEFRDTWREAMLIEKKNKNGGVVKNA